MSQIMEANRWQTSGPGENPESLADVLRRQRGAVLASEHEILVSVGGKSQP